MLYFMYTYVHQISLWSYFIPSSLNFVPSIYVMKPSFKPVSEITKTNHKLIYPTNVTISYYKNHDD